MLHGIGLIELSQSVTLFFRVLTATVQCTTVSKILLTKKKRLSI